MKITKVKSKAHWGNGVMCQCNHPDPLICHEAEESTGMCYCKCHESFKRRSSPGTTKDARLED